MKTFKAPWDGLLIGISTFSTLLCLGVAVVALKIGGVVPFVVSLIRR